MISSVTLKQFTPLPSVLRGRTAAVNLLSCQRNLWVSNDISNDIPHQQPVEESPSTHIHTKPTHCGGPGVELQAEGTPVSQTCQSPIPSHSIQPLADELHGTKPPQGRGHPSRPNRRRSHVPASLQPRGKRKRNLPLEFTSPMPLEDCISHLPAGIPFPKKPGGCEIVPQTFEPHQAGRSTVYFTRSGVLGMPLQYMYNLDDMDDGDEPVNLGLDPEKSRQITLVIAWPGYKEAAYEILVYTPLYPTAPFATVHGLRQLTKRELAIETLRCIHRWMIEHPWGGERHKGIPEWKLSRETSPGVSAKLVWLSMISPVGDGRWVAQLQKAPSRVRRRNL